MLNNIFNPITINNIKINNRIVFPAFNTSYGTINGQVTPRLIKFHTNISKGGVGLNIVGATSVSPEGRVNYFGLRIDNNKFTSGLKKIFTSIEKNGSIPGIQLTHAGGQGSSLIIGRKPVGPSNGRAFLSQESAISMTNEEIKKTISDFEEAANRAINAGAKAIEIHAAHGYLIHQFLSPITNKRNDKYGGTFNNRIRLLNEIISNIKEQSNHKVILICRISAEDFLPGGLTIADTKKIARKITGKGIDIIDVSAGVYGQRDILYPITKKYQEKRIEFASKIKDATNTPIICSGFISNLSEANKILKENKSDFVAMGRALIADPFLIDKTCNNQKQLIRHCLWCNDCVYDWKSKESLSCCINSDL